MSMQNLFNWIYGSQASPKEKRHFLLWLGISVFFLGLTAWNSAGFLHPDEHFQILKYMQVLQGKQSTEQLSWEYGLQMRPWFQPWVYAQLLKPLEALGLHNPFWQTRYLRFLQAFLCLLLFLQMARYLLQNFRNHPKVYTSLYIASLSWFIPLLCVRTSSDSLSAIIIGLVLVDMLTRLNNFKCSRVCLWSFALGLAGLIRYPTLIISASLLIYIVFKHRPSFKHLIIASLVFLFTICLELLFNKWGYGHFVSSTWMHIKINVFQNKAQEFGSEPIYYYLTQSLLKGIPPISLLLGYLAWLYFKKNRLDLFAVAFFPYFIIHCGLTHKELRFLFPILIFLPLVSSLGYLSFKNQTSTFFKYLWIPACFINFCLLAKIGLTNAYSPIKIYQSLYDRKISQIYTLYDSPDSTSHLNLDLKFYQFSPIQNTPMHFNQLQQLKSPFWLLSSRYVHFSQIQKKLRCSIVDNVYPRWLLHYNLFNWLSRSSIWTLWKCNRHSLDVQ